MKCPLTWLYVTVWLFTSFLSNIKMQRALDLFLMWFPDRFWSSSMFFWLFKFSHYAWLDLMLQRCMCTFRAPYRHSRPVENWKENGNSYINIFKQVYDRWEIALLLAKLFTASLTTSATVTKILKKKSKIVLPSIACNIH